MEQYHQKILNFIYYEWKPFPLAETDSNIEGNIQHELEVDKSLFKAPIGMNGGNKEEGKNEGLNGHLDIQEEEELEEHIPNGSNNNLNNPINETNDNNIESSPPNSLLLPKTSNEYPEREDLIEIWKNSSLYNNQQQQNGWEFDKSEEDFRVGNDRLSELSLDLINTNPSNKGRLSNFNNFINSDFDGWSTRSSLQHNQDLLNTLGYFIEEEEEEEKEEEFVERKNIQFNGGIINGVGDELKSRELNEFNLNSYKKINNQNQSYNKLSSKFLNITNQYPKRFSFIEFKKKQIKAPIIHHKTKWNPNGFTYAPFKRWVTHSYNQYPLTTLLLALRINLKSYLKLNKKKILSQIQINRRFNKKYSKNKNLFRLIKEKLNVKYKLMTKRMEKPYDRYFNLINYIIESRSLEEQEEDGNGQELEQNLNSYKLQYPASNPSSISLQSDFNQYYYFQQNQNQFNSFEYDYYDPELIHLLHEFNNIRLKKISFIRMKLVFLKYSDLKNSSEVGKLTTLAHTFKKWRQININLKKEKEKEQNKSLNHISTLKLFTPQRSKSIQFQTFKNLNRTTSSSSTVTNSQSTTPLFNRQFSFPTSSRSQSFQLSSSVQGSSNRVLISSSKSTPLASNNSIIDNNSNNTAELQTPTPIRLNLGGNVESEFNSELDNYSSSPTPLNQINSQNNINNDYNGEDLYIDNDPILTSKSHQTTSQTTKLHLAYKNFLKLRLIRQSFLNWKKLNNLRKALPNRINQKKKSIVFRNWKKETSLEKFDSEIKENLARTTLGVKLTSNFINNWVEFEKEREEEGDDGSNTVLVSNSKGFKY